MKYSPLQYAKAFYSLAENKNGKELGETGKKCASFLSKNGDMPKSREIIKELEKISDKKNGVERIRLESAEKPDADSLKKNFKKGTVVMWKQNKEMIAGAAVQIGDERVDNTVMGRVKRLKEDFL